MSDPSRAGRVLGAATVALAAVFALRRLDDFDTWWHLASGRWIYARRAVPGLDTLSFTVGDHEWLNLQWLYDLFLYLVHLTGGADLLVLVSAACFTLATALLAANIRLALGPVAAALATLWALVVAQERFLIRPEMFSFIFIEALLWLLLTARRSEGRRLWLMVPLMALWVNCHSLFSVGLFCIGAYTAAVVVVSLLSPGGDGGFRRRLLWSAAAAAVATAANPYGIGAWALPVELMTRIDGSSQVFQAIGEFRPPYSSYFTTFSITAYQFFLPASAAVMAVAAGAWLFRRGPCGGDDRGLEAASLLLFAGLAWLSLLARRNTGIFAYAAMPLVALALARLRSGGRTSPGAGADVKEPGASSALAAWTITALVACLALSVVSNAWFRAEGSTHEFGLGVVEENFPIGASRFSRAASLPGPLYNDMTSGGYLAWDPPVDGGVFIDGRLEVYDAEFFSAYRSALSFPAAWKEQADAYGVNTVVLFHRWGNRQALIRWLSESSAWLLVYHDEVAAVFVRRKGHEGVILRARRMFPPLYRSRRNELLSPGPRWPYQVGRVAGLMAYGTFLFNVGERDEGAAMYEHLLTLGPPPRQEAGVRLRLARHLLRRGERARARQHLEAAQAAYPRDKRAGELLKRLAP